MMFTHPLVPKPPSFTPAKGKERDKCVLRCAASGSWAPYTIAPTSDAAEMDRPAGDLEDILPIDPIPPAENVPKHPAVHAWHDYCFYELLSVCSTVTLEYQAM